MRENFMYGLTRVRRKQYFNINAPSSYSTNDLPFSKLYLGST
jgi:hypothetical protein